MTIKNIIQAWTDEEYRLSLSEAERALLPDNPAGQIELAETGLQGASGVKVKTHFKAGRIPTSTGC